MSAGPGEAAVERGVGADVAGPASPRRVAGDQHRVLLARVGGERFALPLRDLREAVDAPRLTPVALAPEGLAGQTPYRGRLLPVFDAGVLFGVPREGGPGALLVLESESGAFGLWVDDVEDMVSAPRRAWRALPADAGKATNVLRALLALEDGIAALVDVALVRSTVAARLRTEAP